MTDVAEMTKEHVFDLIPGDAVKVKVKTTSGTEKWRDPEDVKSTDMIVLNQGQPVVMMSKPGAPAFRDALSQPEPPTEAVMKAKEKSIGKDSLRKVVEKTPESRDVLHEVMKAIANEAASLEFDRKEAERKGEDTRPYSVTRLQALKAIGDTWIKRIDQITVKGVDMESPQFRALLKVLVKTFRESMLTAGCRREQVDSAVAYLAKKLDSDEWENEAVASMKV